MLEKYSIKSQILISFTVMATLTMLITASLALNSINTVGQETTELSEDVMLDQVNRNMLLSSEEAGGVAHKQGTNGWSVVLALASATKQIFSQRNDVFQPKQSYLDLQVNLIADSDIDPDYGIQISRSVSTYYVPQITIENLDVSLTESMNETIMKTGNLDIIFSSLLEENPEFSWLKVVFEEDKIMRRFPGSIISTNRNYDPTLDPWYLAAKASLEPLFTLPFVDPIVNSWVITIAAPLYDEENKFLGVAAGDLTLAAIQEKIGDIEFLESGYATLILPNGAIVAHPQWDLSGTNLANVREIETNLDASPAISLGLLEILTSGSRGIEEFIKDEITYLISHTEPIFSILYVLVIVPKHEAIEGVNKIREEIKSTEDEITNSIIIVSFITMILILVVGLFISDRISKPINKLSEIAQEMVKNVTEPNYIQQISYVADGSDDEIGRLQQSFSSLITNLKEGVTKKSKV
ncbi:MAG: HAMP domain-containing protein [Candidatus Heimdallarchaeota archaeon]|nr:HAMP domain-containing protein [Candidatus Heimdallarchaeota archaeon]